MATWSSPSAEQWGLLPALWRLLRQGCLLELVVRVENSTPRSVVGPCAAAHDGALHMGTSRLVGCSVSSSTSDSLGPCTTKTGADLDSVIHVHAVCNFGVSCSSGFCWPSSALSAAKALVT